MMTTAMLALALSSPPQEAMRLDQISDSFEELAVRINPAIVQIQASGFAIGQGLVSSRELVSEQRSRGSGVILSADGYIITNAHVVTDARRVRVLIPQTPDASQSVLGSRGRLVGAQIVGIDAETDLAVLKIQEDGLPFLTLGDSDSIRPGQIVLAFGSPLGLENTVTMGVVSSVARQLQPEDPMIYIQTDASINPGNSGGPLVDSEGHVVGINTLIISQSGGYEGLGFAAPSNIVSNVFEQIRATGRVHRGEIGVSAQTISPLMARGLGLPQDWGVILSDVDPSGPAATAGLEPGDIVLTMGGKTMENGRQLRVNVYQRRVDERVDMEILRGNDRRTVTVKVGGRRRHPDRFASMVRPEENLVLQLGILGIDLDSELAKMFSGLRRTRGVIVAARAVEATTWDGEGLMPGDVIYSVNRLDVAGLTALKAAIARYYPGDPIVLQVERQGRLRYVTLEVY